MFQRIKLFIVMSVITMIAYIASAGVHPYSWINNYQPAPPKELKR